VLGPSALIFPPIALALLRNDGWSVPVGSNG